MAYDDSTLDDVAEKITCPPRGEKGKKGESRHDNTTSDGRTKGESGRNSPAEGRTDDDFSPGEAKRRAREVLNASHFRPPDYPVEALGEVLAPAARACAEHGQLAPAMAGQSFLGAAAVLAQGRRNVRTLAGVKPLSCYLLTIAESGDGKSTADGAALAPIKAWQRERSAVFVRDKARFDEEASMRKKGEPPPAPPLEPWILMRDATVEGIRCGFQCGRSSQGVFTAEAAAMLAGYGMSKDNRQKTCAVFNDLWDDGELSVSRVLAGRVHLYGKRLSAHWLIQPEAARESLGDPLLSAMGFWPRFLIAWPESSPPRKAATFEPARCPAIDAAWTRFTELLQDPTADDCSALPVVEITDDAKRSVLNPAFERFEREAKAEGGSFAGIRPFALRATEIVCRVAGVLAEVDGATRIDTDAARRALSLVGYSVDTWRTLAGDREEAEGKAWALCLYDWMVDHGGRASETAMLRTGPKRHALRSAGRRDTALSILEISGLVQRMGSIWWCV